MHICKTIPDNRAMRKKKHTEVALSTTHIIYIFYIFLNVSHTFFIQATIISALYYACVIWLALLEIKRAYSIYAVTHGDQ